MLNDRRRTILKALVREYVRSAHPVGSRVLAEKYDLDCSPATVRNDLAVLEETGFVLQPHVSAGRVPTDVGYRAFVDDMVPEDKGTVTQTEVDAVRERLRSVESEMSGLMRETATLLNTLTSYAAVVLAPTLRRSRVRRVDLVPLSARRLLVVLITDNGQVAKRTADLTEDVEPEEIAQIEALLNSALDGRVADEVRGLSEELASAMPRPEIWLALLDEIFSLLTEADETGLVHGGTAKLLEEPEFEDPEMVRSIVGLFEDGLVLAETLAQTGRAHDVMVSIGHENILDQLGHMSVVIAPYGQREDSGFVGLLGPTRMDYARAIESVRCVAKTLDETFGG